MQDSYSDNADDHIFDNTCGADITNVIQSRKGEYTKDEESLDSLTYEKYYNEVLLQEQPFYRSGMTGAEAKKELEYLNHHLQSFYEGTYIPLWRQFPDK